MMQLSHGRNTDETPMADTLVTRFGSKAGTLFGGLSSRRRTGQSNFPVCVSAVFHPWLKNGFG